MSEKRLAGFSGLAKILTEMKDVDPPLDRRQVYTWYARRTKNRAGVPFPGPAKVDMSRPISSGMRRQFRIDDVVSWYEGGPPIPGWPGVRTHQPVRRRPGIDEGK